MPRAPRIEFPGAVYHVLARGDRREPIVSSDEDRQCFVETLEQACVRAGWEVFAWVLMENHYHLALRTPEPNLVAGMSWFQNTFTRRINTRNELWGHLFGGRYKSILVEDSTDARSRKKSDYLATLMNYIHLNPARAGLVDGTETSVLDYPWSSVAAGYAKPPSKRPSWLAVPEGLSIFNDTDRAAGRRQFVERLDQIAAEEGIESGRRENPGQQSLQSTLRRGWYWGSEEFRERLVEEFGPTIPKGKDRELRSSELFRDHGKRMAKEIANLAEEHFGESIQDLAKGGYGDLRRVAVAWAIARNTTERQETIAGLLDLRTAANVSQRVRRFEEMGDRELSSEIRRWKNKIKKFVC